MEAHPPSYETATLVDVWDIVPRYLQSNDLCAAALVCNKWHAAAVPHIWGNPASHFGIENDAVYVALTRFKRTLFTARLFVRSLTHTLHLPPAHAEIYNGPHSDWLRGVLERLPNLQSLIVRGLPFFDYAALQALNSLRIKHDEDRQVAPGVFELPGNVGSHFQSLTSLAPGFNLRLLDASRCSNITSNSLASALQRFEGLLYLDLSFSYPARHRDVLETLKRLNGLQVLKLRGLGLKDDGIDVLSGSLGLRVRSLDLRENHLTDHSIRTLLDHCFLHENVSDGTGALTSSQRSPMLLPYLGSEMLDIYQGEDFEGFLRNAFTGRFVSRLAIEDVASSGITHLYLAGNDITVEGISGLIRSGRLHVLDVGTISGITPRHPSFRDDERNSLTMPSMERLVPVIAKHASEATNFLRIDHSILTKETMSLHSTEVVQGRLELDDTSLPYNTNDVTELDSNTVRPTAYEMPADSQTPRHELESDPMRFVVPPAPDQTFGASNSGDSIRKARRGSALAPEMVDSLATDIQNTILLSSMSVMDEGTMNNNWCGAMSPVEAGSSGGSATMISQRRPRSYSLLAVERKARLNAHVLSRGNLHPAMLPHVTSIVFTDVPAFSPSRDIADRIILFIKQCAEEASLARKQALLDYAAPPGRMGHASALKNSAHKIFALRRVVLEIASESAHSRNSKASSWVHPNTKSVTEDRDSEMLWSASETDFSFFSDEERVFPTLDTGRSAIFAGASEKELNFGTIATHTAKEKAPVLPKIDNIALLSSFRKESKAVHQGQLAIGGDEAETEGFWDGIIQVIRDNATMRGDEQEDYYGNKFTNNYLYR